MHIKNFVGSSTAAKAVEESWRAMPEHWQKLLQGVQCRVSVKSRRDLEFLFKNNRKYALLIIEPSMVYVSLMNGKYEIVLQNSEELADGKDSILGLKENFLRSVAGVLFHRYGWIKRWLELNIPTPNSSRRKNGLESLFIKVFPFFFLRRDFLERESEVENALFCGLDAAIMLKRET
ncbi:MAG: hypothetical protein Q8P52_02525 [bacterium]|nr:hypothetical protein [bacterium]